eukprot:g24075.t1
MLPQFRDAMVRLAAIKYPQLSRTEAVLQIFKNLATFQGQTKGAHDLKDDREVFRAAICSQPQGWKSLRFASLSLGSLGSSSVLFCRGLGSLHPANRRCIAGRWLHHAHRVVILGSPPLHVVLRNVRKDTSLCHEDGLAVKRNVAAIEYIPSELRHNGTFLSLWLHSAMQKLNTKPDAKGVGMQDAKNVKTERVVPLAALCVQCGTRCILVSIGYYKTATKTAVGDLRYPGLKVKAGESPYDAAARLCKTRLSSWTEYEVVLYSWMPDWEFEHLRYTEQGRSLVRFWVEQGDFSILDPSAERCFTPALSSPERPLKFSAAKRTVLSPQKILNLAKALALKRDTRRLICLTR